MAVRTFGDGKYGDGKYGGDAPTLDRVYGYGTYGVGTYGGQPPTWEQLRGPQGPVGDTDLARHDMVSVRFPYNTNWLDYPGYGYGMVYRDRQGVCSLSVLSNGPTNFTSGALIGTLPPGFRPLNRVMFPLWVGDPGAIGRVDINTDGTVGVGFACPAGVSYAIMDFVWATAVPGLCVLDGLRTTVGPNQAVGSSAYLATWTAGHVVDRAGVVTAIPAGSQMVSGTSPSTGWVALWMQANGTLGQSFTMATSENNLLLAYYSAPGNNQALLCTFLSVNIIGVSTPVQNDRRWFPYV